MIIACHRSHIDYCASYLLYVNGVVLPHIAASVDLNLPVVGPILRRGFFCAATSRPIRFTQRCSRNTSPRSSRAATRSVLHRGRPLMPGRLLQPKAGMLVMTCAFVRQSRPGAVPAGVHRLRTDHRARAISMNSRAAKQKEPCGRCCAPPAVPLRRTYGQVAVNYAEPVLLDRCSRARAGLASVPPRATGRNG